MQSVRFTMLQMGFFSKLADWHQMKLFWSYKNANRAYSIVWTRAGPKI